MAESHEKVDSTENGISMSRSHEKIDSTENEITIPGSHEKIDTTENEITIPGSHEKIDTTENEITIPGSHEKIDSTENEITMPGSHETLASTDNEITMPGSHETIDTTENKITMPGSHEKIDSTENEITMPGSHEKIDTTENETTMPGSHEKVDTTENEITMPGSHEKVDSTENEITIPGSHEKIDSTENEITMPGSHEKVDSTEYEITMPGSHEKIDTIENKITMPGSHEPIESTKNEITMPRSLEKVDSTENETSMPGSSVKNDSTENGTEMSEKRERIDSTDNEITMSESLEKISRTTNMTNVTELPGLPNSVSVKLGIQNQLLSSSVGSDSSGEYIDADEYTGTSNFADASDFKEADEYTGASNFPDASDFKEADEYTGASNFPDASDFKEADEYTGASNFPDASDFKEADEYTGASNFPDASDFKEADEYIGASDFANASDFIDFFEDDETCEDPINKKMSNATSHGHVDIKIPLPQETRVTIDRIDLKWTPPERFADEIDFYEVLHKENNKTEWKATLIADKSHETSITGLKPGTEYNFKVKTIFKNKERYFSEPHVTIRTVPLTKKPSLLTGKDITNQSLVLAWTYPDDDVSIDPFDVFDIRYRQKSNNKWLHVGSTDKFVTINKLLPETVYEFKVRAVFENSFGDYSDVSTLSTVADIDVSQCEDTKNDFLSGVCKVTTEAKMSTVQEYKGMQVAKSIAPGKPVAINVSSSSVSLKWDISNIDNMAIRYHEIRYKECNNEKIGWKPYPTHTSANEVTITNLKSMTSYEFTVKAILLTEVTPLSVISDAITTKPFIIDNIEQTGQSHDSIAITWDRPKYDEDIVNYNISFKEDSSMEWKTLFTKARENQIVISELSENTKYHVKVTAITHTGQCPESTIVTKFKTVERPRKNIPGKPHLVNVSSRSVTLKWQQCELSRFECYEIRYRECSLSTTKWIAISTRVKLDRFTVTDLKCETFYDFKVAAVVDGEADRFSEISPKIKTHLSLARHIVKSTKNLSLISEGPPKRYKLPVNFITSDSKAKTRKMELDVDIQTDEERAESTGRKWVSWIKKKVVKTFMVPFNEKNIILVGATGSGKSTLIDGMINFITDVSWDDDFRFSLIDETQDEKNRAKDQTISQTEWITTYQIPNLPGSPLNCTLNIVDTPGFGDTKGITNDQQIKSQIKYLFETAGENGIQTIHGVCFVTQSPLARLTATATYICDSILSVFGKDIAENIFVLITFADGKTPPVLSALNKANVPFKSSFKFNNSALFEPNDASARDGFAKMFWKMGEESFKAFFDHLNIVEPKSLQLTEDVLRTRKTLEVIIIGFQMQVLAGMNQLNTIRQEGAILKQYRKDIEANENFNYIVDDVVIVKKNLKPGQHVTNCLKCNMTCHFPCTIEDNENKKSCSAMADGNCTICPMKCAWSGHTNAPFRIESKTERVTKTYEQLKKKYDVATKRAENRKAALSRIKEKFIKIKYDVSEKITEIGKCLNRLDRYALKSNPLSSLQYIDLLIHSEEMEMKDGYIGRITLLKSFRKDAEIIEQAKTGKCEPFDDEILKEFEIDG